MRTTVSVAAIAAAVALAPAAHAHVTLNPPEWEAGGFARFAIRVPNERDDASTTRIVLRFPDQVLSASFQPVEGWERTVEMKQLEPPIEVDGEEVKEKIDTVTWSGGRIRPGEFQEFGLSIRVPDEPGTELAFPAVQTYSGGEVVRWIGPPDSDAPAPTVSVVAAAEEEEGAAAPAETPAPAAPQESAAGDDGGSDTLAIIALIAGVAGLAAGLAALARGRGPRAPGARTA